MRHLLIALCSSLFVPSACGSTVVLVEPAGEGGSAEGGALSVGGVDATSTSGGSEPCFVDCEAMPTPPCTRSVCNEATDQCEMVDAADGMACDDGNACTTGDICTMGVCAGAAAGATCGAADECCPADCGVNVDPDCTPLTILLMGEGVSEVEWGPYRDALSNVGAGYTERNLATQPFPTAAELAGFNTLLWFNESLNLSLSEGELQVVVDWIDASAASDPRHLLTTGRAFDLHYPEKPLNDRVGAVSSGGSVLLLTLTELVGDSSDPIGGGFVSPNGLAVEGGGALGNKSASTTEGVATAGLLYGPGTFDDNVGRAALTHYDAGTYRAVWFGVNFSAQITDQDGRDRLMAAVLSYFQQ